MYPLIARHWFLFMLGFVLVVGLSLSEPLEGLTRAKLARDLIVASVLFVTTLPLETKAIGDALRRPVAPLLATAINYGLLPLAAWAISWCLRGEWATGLMVAAAAPCTIASAAVWTRRAGGNDVVALMVTVLTNLICFVATPLWLSLTTGRGDVHIELLPMIRKLALLVLLPMLLAQIFRNSSSVAKWSTASKRMLSTAAQCGILAIVLIGAVHCGLRIRESELNVRGLAMQFAAMLAAVVVLHVVILWVGFWLGRFCRLDRPEWIAVGFAGSQKTLMVGLQVALMVGGGLTILPMVAYHVCQLMIDTVVADRLAADGRPSGHL